MGVSSGQTLHSKSTFLSKAAFNELDLTVDTVIQKPGELILTIAPHQGYGLVRMVS
jgi:hypothetical protein